MKGHRIHCPITPFLFKRNFTLQKLFLGLGFPQREKLPILFAYIQLLFLEGPQGWFYPWESGVLSG